VAAGFDSLLLLPRLFLLCATNCYPLHGQGQIPKRSRAVRIGCSENALPIPSTGDAQAAIS
jgi:hypothetical protein